MSVKEIETALDIDKLTANRLSKAFEEVGLFKEITGYTRNRNFVLKEYFDLFGDKK